jgi:hypothetical protein
MTQAGSSKRDMMGRLALDLSAERITLLGDAGTGWFRIGDIRFGSAHFPDGVERLRRTARLVQRVLLPESDADAPKVLLVLPETQVEWLNSVDADALDGMRLDVRETPDGVRLALVPLATLAEAEEYVSGLGFAPTGTIAPGPPGSGFDTAWFGLVNDPTEGALAASRQPVVFDRRHITAHPPAELATAMAADTAARQRAEAAARVDPSHLRPLPDSDEAVLPSRPGRRLAGLLWPRAGRVAGLTLLLAGALGAVAYLFAPSTVQAPVTGAPAQIVRAPDLTDGSSDLTEPDAAARAEAPVLPGDPAASASLTERPGDDEIAELEAEGPQDTADAAAAADSDTLVAYYTPAPGLSAPIGLELAPGDTLNQPGLDPAIGADALALPPAWLPSQDDRPRPLTAPPLAELQFAVDARGLVLAVPSGAVSPDGHLVFAGPPPALPARRPETVPDAALPPPPLTDRAALAEDDPLRRLSPRQRPEGLRESHERSQLGGRTRQEMAGFRPEERPASIQETAAAATAPTQYAIAAGPRPPQRPADLRQRAERSAQRAATAAVATASTAAVATPAPARTAPAASAAPSRDVVARSQSEQGTKAATDPNKIDLSEVNLLGTFGRGSALRALVRMPDGDVVNVSVGDRMDGGQVQAIGTGQLTYVKRGRAVTLRMPKG